MSTLQHVLLWTMAVVVGTGCSARRQLPVDTRAESMRLERAVHDEINRVRASHGLSRLKSDGDLAEIARAHSKDMGRRSYFAHNTPEGRSFSDRYKKEGYVCRVRIGALRFATGAENLSMTQRYGHYFILPDGSREEGDFQTVSALARDVVDRWMNSPGHRKNILTSHWGREGIGVYLDSDGEIYVTQNFC